MRPSAVLDLLAAIESEVAVDSWKADDVALWPFIRYMLWYENDDYRARAPSENPTSGFSRQLARVTWRLDNLAGIATGRISRAAAERRDPQPRVGPIDAMFFGDNTSRTLLDGVWFDRVCGPVMNAVEELGYAAQLLEPGTQFRTPRRGRSRWIQPDIDLISLRAYQSPVPFQRTLALPGFEEFFRILEDHGVNLAPFSTVRLQRHAAFILMLRKWWTRQLQRYRPRAVFIVDYGPAQMALCSASFRCGVPSIELQHGVQGSQHWAYARWNRVPADGYELLPTQYWTWSNHEATEIAKWAHRTTRHRAVVSGLPWIDWWSAGADPTVRSLFTQADAALSDEPSPRYLVTLQPGLLDRRALGPVADAIALTGSTRGWIVRAHPAMSIAERDDALSQLNLTASQRSIAARASELPMPALMRSVDAHVTHSSSSALEAASFGLPTVLFGEEADLIFSALVASGRATIASSGPAVLRALEACERVKPTSSDTASPILSLVQDLLVDSE